MAYTISQVSKLTGISPSTIRYYDKEGLLPRVERKNGIRLFTDTDIRWFHLLTCLKNTGMPIKRIREYAKLTLQGDTSLKERQALIREQRQFVQDQIDQLLFYSRNWISRNGTTIRPCPWALKAKSTLTIMKRKRGRKRLIN